MKKDESRGSIPYSFNDSSSRGQLVTPSDTSDRIQKISYFKLNRAPVTGTSHMQIRRNAVDSKLSVYKQDNTFDPRSMTSFDIESRYKSLELESVELPNNKAMMLLNTSQKLEMSEDFYEPIFFKIRKANFTTMAKPGAKPKKVELERMENVALRISMLQDLGKWLRIISFMLIAKWIDVSVSCNYHVVYETSYEVSLGLNHLNK